MTHREYAPDPVLRRDIHSLWMIDETQQEYNRDPVVPDSYTKLVFNCGAPLAIQLSSGAKIELPRVFFAQLRTQPILLQAHGQAQFVAISFYPWTAHALFDLRAPNDQPIIPLDSRWDWLADSVENALRHRGYEEALARLQQFMLDVYSGSLPDITPVRAAGEQLYTAHGQFNMDALADQSYLSLRQLERRFKVLTGVTPKSLARLIRFEAVRNRLFSDPTMAVLDLVHEYGFTDQAHLTHEFKAFTTRTPGQFIAHYREFPRKPPDDVFLQYA